MEGITPPLVPVAFFSICVYSTFQNGFLCVSGHEILKKFVYFTWEHQKVAVWGHFASLCVTFLVAKLGFSKLELKSLFCDSFILYCSVGL